MTPALGVAALNDDAIVLLHNIQLSRGSSSAVALLFPLI
tara:strand:- start:164 stop:280 length:117 start_codon:yes stop_codon:yes gene_type:complete